MRCAIASAPTAVHSRRPQPPSTAIADCRADATASHRRSGRGSCGSSRVPRCARPTAPESCSRDPAGHPDPCQRTACARAGAWSAAHRRTAGARTARVSLHAALELFDPHGLALVRVAQFRDRPSLIGDRLVLLVETIRQPIDQVAEVALTHIIFIVPDPRDLDPASGAMAERVERQDKLAEDRG